MSKHQPADTAARRLVETLVLNGVDRVFCVPGESYLAVLDALYDVRDKIEVVACRHEAARSIEDILARRSRALFLDAGAADACIGRVGEIVVEELQLPEELLPGMVAQAEQSARRFQLS